MTAASPLGLGIAVDRLERMRPEQTTSGLARAAVRRGHRVWAFDVAGLGIAPGGRPHAHACPTSLDGAGRLALGPRERLPLDALDVVLMRHNPATQGAPWFADALLSALSLLAERGTRVLNDPRALTQHRSKLALAALPEGTVPRTLFSMDRDEVRAFVGGCPHGAVLKPSHGSHGRDVFRVHGPDDPNLAQILAVLARDGLPVVQEFVPAVQAEDGTGGDQRVLVTGGAILRVEGKPCVVRRLPPAGDFRSNVSAGGHAVPGVLTDAQRRTVLAVAAHLDAQGIFLAGLDLVGDLLVEANVWAPGGLADAGKFAGVDFEEAVIARIERMGPLGAVSASSAAPDCPDRP